MMTELFLLPFLTGLALAVVLPLVGCYLRLRDEWLAALAYAHVAAAGALVAVLTGLSPLLGGLMAAGAAGAGKRVLSRRLSGGGAFPVLLLAGWAAGVLVTANHPVAERLGNALFDGQLYFAQGEQLTIAVAWGIVALLLLRRLSPHLLLSHVYPDFFRMRGVGAWPVQAGFDLLAALTLALATMSIGVMGAFALVFIPPWLAFQRARNWRAGLLRAVTLGVSGYVIAFGLALWLDQAFGPTLALVMVALLGT
jgi:zinc/manganese transport system permease protein